MVKLPDEPIFDISGWHVTVHRSIDRNVARLAMAPALPAPDANAPPTPEAIYDRPRSRPNRAVFSGGVRLCPRCGVLIERYMAAVRVAPPGLPRTVIHTDCLEVGDEIYPPPAAPDPEEETP